MKYSKLQRMLSVAIATMVAIGMMLSSTVGTFAATQKWRVDIGNYGNNTAYAGETTSCWAYDMYSGKDAKITSVTSGNKKVATVKKHKFDDGYTYYEIKAKKKGTAKFTIKYKKPNGRTVTVKKILTVKAYPNHIKSLKVNGKAVKLKGEKRFWYTVRNNKTTAKINIKMRNGWKITNVYGDYHDKNGKSTKIKNVKNLVKNGKNIKFAKKYTNLYIGIEMKKGKNIIFYDINMYR